MASIKGKWVFNDYPVLTTNITESVNFTSNGKNYTSMEFKSGSKGRLYYDTDYYCYYDGERFIWSEPLYRTVDFGSTEQTVSDTWYSVFTANATQLVGEPTVTITYNNNIIAEIEAGQTATLNCAGKKMATDISITAPEVKEANLQEKSITENCEATPDEGYDGFSKVIVDVPIPDGYIIPTGTKEITENGTYDVTEFANTNVNIPIPVVEMYDGMVTYSGGDNLISFTIDDTSYQADAGMTWAEWVESEYNTDAWSCGGSNNFVTKSGYNVSLDSTDANRVLGYNTIVDGHAYQKVWVSHDGGEVG